MSEKRFTFYEYDDGSIVIEDTENDESYGVVEVCGLLNEQQATIEQKDKEIKRLKSLLDFSEHMIDANLVVELKYSYGKWNADVSVIDDE